MVAEQDGAVIAESDSFEASFSVTARELDKVSAINVKITVENANGETAEASISVPCALREEETASGWAKSAYIQKTGVWADDLLSVAKTQLGYRESERNFIIDSKGETFGYTRYGDWYGAKYRDWCAMFVSFCLNYADVPADYFPREASSQDWIGELKYLNLYEKANEYTPAPGDLIFFDWERDGAADHVGLVEKVDNDTVYTIEGNNGKVVAEHRYALNAKEILGYGKVSAAQEKYASAHTPNVDLENIAGAKAVVSASEANLRSEASAASERVAKLEQGTSLTIESVEQSTDGYWYKVESETEQGYIRADLVEVSETDEEPQIDAEPEITAEPQTATTQDGNVTVTFVINNSVYTSDNGLTHVTSKTASTDYPNTELKFTKWAGVYKIEGTGVLASYSIPAGTCMSESGVEYPGISVTNITGSTNTYVSLTRWISQSDNTIYDANTVFTKDVTFELRLATDSSTYPVEYVCGTDDHNILYFLTSHGYRSINVGSGEHLEAASIPTAEDVYNYYSSSWCSHGKSSNEIVEGWYMDSAYTIPLTSTTDLYSYASNNTIKVYAKWKTLTDSDYAIVTFTGSETRKVVKGFKLGDLPSADSAWIDAATGEQVSSTTIVTGDMTLILESGLKDFTVSVLIDGETTAYTVRNGAKLATAVDASGNSFGSLNPEKAGYVFTGWKDESGNAVTGDTIVSGDMTITAVYAELVNVHFVSVNPVNASDTSDEIYTVEKGAQLSAAKDVSGNPIGENLPEAKAYDGYEFIGWFYKVDDTSNGAEASLTQTIAAETYFTANYEKIEACTLTLHDVKPDGTEYTQDGVSSIDIRVPAGGKLRDALAEYELYDGVDASTCIWYTQKGTAKEKLDLDAALTANADIYTYTYQLKLSVGENSASLKDVLFPTAYAATTDVTGGTLTLTAREGEKLKASDFVVNGVDYSLYTWTKSDNTTISASDLIANGLTGNIEAVGTQAVTATKRTITFKVRVDDEWVDAAQNLSVDTYPVTSDSYTNYYVTAAQLESVYGKYGFSASDLNTSGYTQFPFINSSWLFGANSGQVAENTYGSCVSYYGAYIASEMYYMPGEMVNTAYLNSSYVENTTYACTSNTFYTITLKDADNATIRTEYGRGNIAKTVELGAGDWTCETDSTIAIENGVATIPANSMTKAYTFKRTTPAAYSITLVDDFHQVYTAAQLNTLNTEHQNYPVETPAENVQITVNAPASAEYYWNVFEADGTTEVGSNEYAKTENGETITFTFAVVNKHYMIKLIADGDVITVKYITNELTAEQCGTSYPASTQTKWPGGRGPSTVQGQDTPYIEQVVVNDQTQYSVKAPDTRAYRSRAAYGSKGDMLFTYRFWGWELTDKDGNAVVLSANDMLDKAKLSQYAVNGTVTLTARYSAKQNASDARIATASFFVIVNSKLADVGGGSTETPIGNYSDALYTTAVYGDVNDIALSGSNGQLIYASTGALTAAEVDTKIRALTEGYTNNGKTVYLDNLPSDEYCLSRLRTWASRGTATDITIDDVKIPTENLTTENYTIRWFVFKYDGTDGWHIDGLLVPKQGKLTIKKTFDGNAAAVAAVKANFEITVTKSGETTAAHRLNLNEKTDNNAGGYTEYDAATDTYTWVVDINQTQKYTVAENNYAYTTGDMTTSAEYAISNSSGSTSGYRKYTGAVEVTGYAYATDIEYVNYQTVAFRNTYIPSGTLVVRKVDSVTGQAIQGVSFVLKKDGKIVTLYKAGDSYYLYKPEDDVAYETITDGTVTTNASGYFNFVRQHGSAETFTLEEQPLPGYKAIEPIRIEADANGKLTVTSEDTASVYDPTTRTITVTNTAERLLKITVKKEWAEGDTKKDVKVHLMYNGSLIRTGNAADDVTLNEGNNWTHEWTDQPLYVNGKPVTYSIRETWIGDTAYSANADADGYQDYVVTVDPMVYDYGDGTTGLTAIKEGTENKYAQSGTITVHNATYKGQIVFQKTDEDGKPLGGATFKLYADEDMSGTPRAEATSNGNGQVSFGEMPVGTYYFMKETNSPAGYKDNATKYRVTITSTGTKIEYLDGTDWKALNGAVINEKIKTAEITLLKVNEKGNALSGAAFQLRNAKGENIGVAQITDAAGKITFTGLTPGGYQLVETAAPAGYYKMTATIEFTVNEDGTVNMVNTNGSWSLAGTTFTVTNHAGSELPETGGSGTIPYTIGGLLLMAASLLCGLNPRRRRERRCER